MADSNREVVDLISDSEGDEDLKRAIALSLQDQDALEERPKDVNPGNKDDLTRKEPSLDSMGLLALDRKQMEKDRLARLPKRQNPTSTQDLEVPPPKRRMKEQTYSTLSDHPAPAPSSSKLSFPRGVVKRTWAYGYPRTKDDIKIEEVLQKDHLQLAILSSFQWDEEWLLSKINMDKTKLVLVAYAPDEAQVSNHHPLPILISLHQAPKPCISAAMNSEDKK